MILRVLGCSGGIDGSAHRTTAFLLDHDILLDAGTGVGDLSLAEMVSIDHVFVTHAHLDHIAALPLMLDAVSALRQTPVTVYAIEAVIQTLRLHIFNNAIWPDFTLLPNSSRPWLRFQPIEIGKPIEIGGRKITALPVEHTVPAVGYCIESGSGALVFSGDTGPCDDFWAAVNAVQNLKVLIVECAFPDTQSRLAQISKHLCPTSLNLALDHLESAPMVMLTHLKPGFVAQTRQELDFSARLNRPDVLRPGKCITL